MFCIAGPAMLGQDVEMGGDVEMSAQPPKASSLSLRGEEEEGEGGFL